MAVCVYCAQPGATLRINRDAHAHRRCFTIADRLDEAAMWSGLATATLAPEELVALSRNAAYMRRARAAARERARETA